MVGDDGDTQGGQRASDNDVALGTDNADGEGAAEDAPRSNQSSFDAALERLPLKQPPLRAQQLIQFDASHRPYVAVDTGRFLCTLSVAQREHAVEDFYGKARREFEAAGIDDFTMVLTRIQPTGVNYPKLAHADPRGVRLTRAGRA